MITTVPPLAVRIAMAKQGRYRLTPADLECADKDSGYCRVEDASKEGGYRATEGWRPRPDGRPGTIPGWRGHRHGRAVDAAQEFCDHVNGDASTSGPLFEPPTFDIAEFDTGNHYEGAKNPGARARQNQGKTALYDRVMGIKGRDGRRDVALWCKVGTSVTDQRLKDICTLLGLDMWDYAPPRIFKNRAETEAAAQLRYAEMREKGLVQRSREVFTTKRFARILDALSL